MEPTPGDSKQTQEKKCLNLTLLDTSKEEVLKYYPAEYVRVVADRVLLRPCMTEEHETLPLRPLAVVQDGLSQSILVVPSVALWHGPADVSMSGRAGYPVLPISIAQETPPQPPPAGEQSGAAPSSSPPTPPPSSPAAAEAAVEEAAPDTAAAAEEEEAPTLWEQIEEPWRMLEASGVLTIERDEDSMPTRVSLPESAAAWQGELQSGLDVDSGATRMVTVRLIDGPTAERIALRGNTAMPECGFCKFMRSGPCGDEFKVWEKCVDAAREEGKDFVEHCGKPTLALKACTDAHDYYSVLGGEAE